uniref:Uncharacterized protein n=1 Tax=Arundo donax TaxID=35708 RepID=A0A0A8ZN83_ARUDO
MDAHSYFFSKKRSSICLFLIDGGVRGVCFL